MTVSNGPNKDARARRSVRLQLGTPQIQRSTETRQVSVVMGMTRFWLLSALSMLRAQQPPTRLVWLRLGTDSPDGSELTWPCPYICLSFHTPWVMPFQWGVPLTFLELVLVRSFSYTPRAGFSEEFLLHSSSWFQWGVSLTLLELVFVRSFSYTPDASFREELLLHSSSWFWWGVSLTFLELVLVRSFPYTPRAGFREEFPLHCLSRL